MTVAKSNPVTFHGTPVTLIGMKLKKGDRARDIKVSSSDLSPVLPLDSSPNKTRLFLTLPSLDTEVCATETKKFSNAIEALDDSVVAYVISADLPFAQNRWRTAEGIDNLIMLSDYRNLDFARNWGLLIKELALLTRAVYIVDQNNQVVHYEIVPEITSEPNYEAALTALRAVV